MICEKRPPCGGEIIFSQADHHQLSWAAMCKSQQHVQTSPLDNNINSLHIISHDSLCHSSNLKCQPGNTCSLLGFEVVFSCNVMCACAAIPMLRTQCGSNQLI